MTGIKKVFPGHSHANPVNSIIRVPSFLGLGKEPSAEPHVLSTSPMVGFFHLQSSFRGDGIYGSKRPRGGDPSCSDAIRGCRYVGLEGYHRRQERLGKSRRTLFRIGLLGSHEDGPVIRDRVVTPARERVGGVQVFPPLRAERTHLGF